MNYPVAHMLLRPLRLVARLFALSALLATAALAADAGTGTVAGSVTSAGTRNALQGAMVTIGSQTGLTDSAGAYSISNVPAGGAEIVISYPGFTDARQPVTVTAGGRTTADVTMKSSDLVTMEKFTVDSVKEGQALSIQEQRNALNIKNVTAFDEWGILPTQNIGELVSRLPGITFTTDEDDLINNVSIRGQPSSYTRLNIDGMSSTGVGGDGRTATLHSFSGAMYEQVEIVAGQTPDKRADSLGGQLNLKTRSPLANAERRRTTYTLSGRWFPSWSDRNDAVAQRPWRPDFNASYTQVFDAGQGHRNLGIVVSASYQEVLNPHDWDIMQYQNTTSPVAALRDYDRRSGLNDRFLSAVSARADYRWSPSTTVSLRFLYNAGSEPFFHYTFVNPFYSSSDTPYDPVTNPTGGIMPGFTTHRTEIRPAGNAQMLLNIQRYSFTSKNPTGTLAFEHNWGRLKVDHAYRWSNTHWDSGAGRQREDGQLQMRTTQPIGFILDNTNDLHGVSFTQTAGPNVYDPASYAPIVTAAANPTTIQVPQTSVIFTKRDTVTDTNEVDGNINASYAFATQIPITVKTGFDSIFRRVNNRNVYPRRWYGVAGATLPAASIGLMPLTEFERQNGGRRLPIFDPASVTGTLGNPALWTEDVNFTATQQKTNRRIMEEGVNSGYVQGTARFGPLTVLSGVRVERVRTHVFTYFPRNPRATIASQPDPFKRAEIDFARYERDGHYQKSFPSVHLSYDVTRNFKARASWSTSYGRALLANLISAPTPNDAAQTVTIGNPSIKPQMAKNIDLKLEYYASNGMISVTGYQKKITDYIASTSSRSGEKIGTGADNGFDGLYGGYELVQPTNVGDAEVKGIEVDFRQRLVFLPGVLKGLTLRGNYTNLRTNGKFTGTVSQSSGQIAGFIPRAYNLGLQYVYGRWGASYDVNYTSEYPVLFSATTPNSLRIREALTRMNAGLTYKVRPEATLFLTVNNITEEAPGQYVFSRDRPRAHWVTPQSIKFGVTGQF